MRSTQMCFQRWVVTALALGMWIFAAGVVHALPGGITGVSGQAGSTCNACHTGAAAPVVTLTGPTTLGPGATGNYTLTLMPSGSHPVGGLDVSASSGVLSNNPAGTRMAAGEITHSAPNDVPATGIVWNFSWTAPVAGGNQTLFAAVASNDGDGTTDGDGTAATTLTVAVTSLNQAPIAHIVGPLTAVEGSMVTFSGSTSTDPDGTIVSYDWNFGDGSAGAGVSVNHVYTAGTYMVTLTVMDNAGATATTTQLITVAPANQPQPPVANPGGAYTGTVGTPVQFNGSGSSDPDGTVTGYLWNFGDGTTATTVSPTHAYVAAGTYTVQLTVTDNSGMTGAAQTTATIIVQTPPPPVGDGAALYQTYCSGCHGTAGRGGPAGSVAGEDAKDIVEAIGEVPAMRFLSILTSTQIGAIGSYLSSLDEDDGDDEHDKDKKKCREGKKNGDHSKCKRKSKRD